MAYVRKSLEEILRNPPTVNRAIFDATTDEDIAADIAADPDLAPDMSDFELTPEPRFLRAAAGMTQEQFAKAIGIPVGTLRNWEQSRTAPDPVALALFRLMAKDLKGALRLLAA